MKVSELNNIIENILSEEVKRAILNESKGESKEVFHIICDGEPYMNCDTQNEAEEHLDKLKKEHPGKQFIIEKTMYESHEDMLHKLDEMGEQLEEKENTNMENQEPMEGNAFGQAVLNAKEKGEKTFEFDGEQHDVEECWKQLEEEEMVGTMEEDFEKNGEDVYFKRISTVKSKYSTLRISLYSFLIVLFGIGLFYFIQQNKYAEKQINRSAFEHFSKKERVRMDSLIRTIQPKKSEDDKIFDASNAYLHLTPLGIELEKMLISEIGTGSTDPTRYYIWAGQ